MQGGCCCPLFTNSWLLVPPFYNELSADELQELYLRSMHLNNGRLIVQGLFARADATNTNGRVYPASILRREVARFRRGHLATGTALGELNHPSYHSAYFRSLNLPNVSHQVLELRWRGAELWGTIEVLPTPAGLLLSELYSKGIKLGVSSRGWASVAPDPAGRGRVLVEADYQLITFDFVPEPSNEGAYVVPVARRYTRRLPDQLVAVAASYVGIGSSSMEALGQLPPASSLRRWLKHTSRAMEAAAKAPGQAALHAMEAAAAGGSQQQGPAALQQPPRCALAGPAAAEPLRVASGSSSNGSSASMLAALSACALQVLPADTPLGGGVVLGCHYHVLHDKPWLPTDPAVRQFKVHLSLVATKARLHQTPHVLGSQQQQQQQGLHHHHHHHHHHQQRRPMQQQQQHEQPLLSSPPSDTSTGSSSFGSLQQQQQGQVPPGCQPSGLSSNPPQHPSDAQPALRMRAGSLPDDHDDDASGSGGSLGGPPAAVVAAAAVPCMPGSSALQQGAAVALAAA